MKRGISTFTGTLIMMVLAVSAGIVIYAYALNYFNFGSVSVNGSATDRPFVGIYKTGQLIGKNYNGYSYYYTGRFDSWHGIISVVDHNATYAAATIELHIWVGDRVMLNGQEYLVEKTSDELVLK